MKECPFCQKLYSDKGIGTHIWRSHGNGKSHDPNKAVKNGEKNVWNKGLTKEDERVFNISQKLKTTLEEKVQNGTYVPIKWSDEFRKLQSEKMSMSNPGGRCKWFEYEKENGTKFKLQGTWELRFARILDDIDPEWIKIGIGDKNHSFKWLDDNDEIHTYTPDFWSPKLEKYFEIKGYWWGNDKVKFKKVLEQNKVMIELIEKRDLESYEKLGR